MSAAFGIKSNCILKEENKFFCIGEKNFGRNSFKNALCVYIFIFASEILNFGSRNLWRKGIC